MLIFYRIVPVHICLKKKYNHFNSEQIQKIIIKITAEAKQIILSRAVEK